MDGDRIAWRSRLSAPTLFAGHPGSNNMERKDSRWLGKIGFLALLDDLEASSEGTHTIYLTAETARSPKSGLYLPEDEPDRSRAAAIVSDMADSETGVAVYLQAERAVAVLPPFPLASDEASNGTNVVPLRRLLSTELTVGVVMLRLGRYAVGVLRGDTLIASKTDSRYVKHRHRAGGTSQRRFERSRERLVRELYDKTCQVVRDVFAPFEGAIDYVLLGGERHTLNGFVKRCRLLQDLRAKTLSRLLHVDRPNQKALTGIAYEVWKSRVIAFE